MRHINSSLTFRPSPEYYTCLILASECTHSGPAEADLSLCPPQTKPGGLGSPSLRPRNGTAAILPKHLINFCWFWFKWGLVASAIGAALMVPYFYQRMDQEIRRRVQELLARQYPGLEIKIHSAVLMKGEGIALRGMSIADPAAEGPGAELLGFDECFLACSTDVGDLYRGQLGLKRVVLRRPTLRMTRRPDGSWSAARLLPLPKLDDNGLPEIRFENGTIEIFDPTKAAACTLTLRDVNLTLSPVAAATGPAATTRRMRVQGTTTGDYFRQVIFSGEVDPDRPELALGGKIEGVEVSPEMRNVLPDALGSNLSVLGSLRGETEVSFQVRYDPASPRPWTFNVTGQLARGRIDDPRLPHALTEIRATANVDNEGFVIRELRARSNQAVLSLTCSGGLRRKAPWHWMPTSTSCRWTNNSWRSCRASCKRPGRRSGRKARSTPT